MKARIVTVVVALAVVVLLGTSAAQAGNFRQVVSGNFLDTAIDTNGDGMAGNGVTGAAKGSGGGSYGGFWEIEFAVTGLCEADEVEGVIVAYSMVRRSANGDLLFSNLTDGFICFDLPNGQAIMVVEAEITGGTGRHSGASGHYTLVNRVVLLLPDPAGGIAHGAFVGEIDGTLE